MNANNDSLAAFFRFDERNSASALARSPALTQARAVPAALRGAAAESIAAAARSMLNSPVSEILGQAWGKCGDLLQYRDTKRFPPDKINDYTLHEHEIALSRGPKVELMFNGAPTGVTLDFELKVGLTLKSAILKIQNARIIGAQLGKLQGAGTFSCGKATLAERKSEEFKFPGALSFGRGFPIDAALGGR